MCYNIGNNTFKTQQIAKNYVRNLLNDIGVCKSIKNTLYYDEIYELVKRHPNFESKCKDIKDFEVIRNNLNKKGLAINIIKNDGSKEDISWTTCVTGKPKTDKSELLSAFRYSIDYQIQNYRNNIEIDKCMICDNNCKKIENHVDHIIPFNELVKDFQKNINKKNPTEFDNSDDNTNRRKFKLEDNEYELEWQKYHSQNAKLRITCKKCNLTRPKK